MRILGLTEKNYFQPLLEVVNEFLNQHFKDIMDYNFTADVEKD